MRVSVFLKIARSYNSKVCASKASILLLIYVDQFFFYCDLSFNSEISFVNTDIVFVRIVISRQNRLITFFSRQVNYLGVISLTDRIKGGF